MRLALLCLVVAVSAVGSREFPSQGFQAASITGTAYVSGTVVNDATPAVPVRRVVVSLADSGRQANRTTIADDEGRFEFYSVPAGRYILSAAKGGFVTSAFGATRPGGPGVPLVIATASRTTGLTLTIVRGGVITGVLRDRGGAPIRDARVYAAPPGVSVDVRFGLRDGSAGGSGMTDDRGAYRIFGLRPGPYLVWAAAPLWVGTGVTPVITSQDIQRARQLIPSAGRGAADAALTAPIPNAGPAVNYADSYYPATASPADAEVIRVRPGEEHTGIDLTWLLVPTARISGSVVDANGRPVNNPRLWIRLTSAAGTRSQFEARTTPAGTFEIPHLMPGEYLIGAEGRAEADRTMWARANVRVNGVDQSNVTLRLQAGLRVTGRVEFEAGPTQLPSAAGLSIFLLEAGQDILSTIPTAITATDGSFQIDGVAAARYRITVSGRNTNPIMTLPAGWRLKSITGAGPDAADVPLDVNVGAPAPNIVITLTSTTTELAGSLQDALGRPATTFTVIAFSVDQVFWTPESRRIQVTRPDDSGRFSLPNLPAGEYFVAALTHVDDNEWRDRRFLQSLVGAGVAATIVDGQRTIQDLKIVK